MNKQQLVGEVSYKLKKLCCILNRMKLKNKHVSVIIWSENYEKLVDWYANVLGFTIRERLTLPDDTCTGFDFGDTYFSIGRHDKVRGVNHDSYRIMIGFNVDSVNEIYDELKNKPVKIIAKPFESPQGGYWCMTIADPEENILQFFGSK